MSRKDKLITVKGHRLKLPPEIRSPYEVYRNGVRQELGRDFRISSGDLVFRQELVREKLSTRAWMIGSMGIGTYKRNDEVDIRYEIDGRPMVAQGLELIPDSKA